MSEPFRNTPVGQLLTIAVVLGIGILLYFYFEQDDSPRAAPAPPPRAAPAPAPPTTTTTASECQTRWAWLADDGGRYDEAVQAMERSGQEVADASGDEALYSALGDYVRAYGPALDLWLRYEADAETLLRDCWDAFTADRIDSLRTFLADQRDWWLDRRAHCRSVREAATSSVYATDPWGLLGVSC